MSEDVARENSCHCHGNMSFHSCHLTIPIPETNVSVVRRKLRVPDIREREEKKEEKMMSYEFALP